VTKEHGGGKPPSPELPEDVRRALSDRGITATGEVALRRALESYVSSYNLFRLSPAAARRWKCRYRVLLEAGYCDGMTVAEAYARAILLVMPAG
jgi:hypothetical protein